MWWEADGAVLSAVSLPQATRPGGVCDSVECTVCAMPGGHLLPLSLRPPRALPCQPSDGLWALMLSGLGASVVRQMGMGLGSVSIPTRQEPGKPNLLWADTQTSLQEALSRAASYPCWLFMP